MEDVFTAFMILTLSLFLNAFFQFISSKILRMALIKSIGMGFFCGFVSFWLLVYILDVNLTLNLLVPFGCYVSASYVFFHFLHIPAASLRIKILSELVKNPNGLNDRELLSLYSSRDIVSSRIERLTQSGELVENDGRFYIGARRLLWVALIIRFWKKLVWVV